MHIIRSWRDAGLPVGSAADSQALIQSAKSIVINGNVSFAVSDMSICGRDESFISLITYPSCIKKVIFLLGLGASRFTMFPSFYQYIGGEGANLGTSQ